MKMKGIMHVAFAMVAGLVAVTSCTEKDEVVKGEVALEVASAQAPDGAQVRATAIVIDGNGGTVTVPVSAGLPAGISPQFTVIVDDAPAWCTASVTGSVLTVEIAKSDETKGRVATLNIGATAAGAEIHPLTVSVQQGEKVIPSGDVTFNAETMTAPASVKYTNGVLDFTYSGGRVVLPITNTLTEAVEVEYTVEGQSAAWCQAVVDNGNLVIDVEPNTAAEVDQTTFTVKGTGKTDTVDLVAATLKINRAPFTSAMSMVYVKGGTYDMGDGMSWRDIWDENYVKIGQELVAASNYYKYPVTVDGFYIATTETTQKLYQQIMGENPTKQFIGDTYPVIGVIWPKACEFCNKLSEKEGLTPVYEKGDIIKIEDPWGYSAPTEIQTYKMIDGANGYRLPTSAEWEFAAKGGNEGVKTLTVYAGSNDADEVMWYEVNSKVGNSASLHEVAKKKPNLLGLYDMSGNAAEWTFDWGTPYSDRDARKAITSAVNPQGPDYKKGMDTKVTRGGHYKTYASKGYCYTEDNVSAGDEYAVGTVGFRVVRGAK